MAGEDIKFRRGDDYFVVRKEVREGEVTYTGLKNGVAARHRGSKHTLEAAEGFARVSYPGRMPSSIVPQTCRPLPRSGALGWA